MPKSATPITDWIASYTWPKDPAVRFGALVEFEDEIKAQKRSTPKQAQARKPRATADAGGAKTPSATPEQLASLVKGDPVVVTGERGKFKFESITKKGDVNVYGGPKNKEAHRAFRADRIRIPNR